MQTAIAGVSGRMGRALLEAVAADADCALYAAIDRPGSPLVGQDAGAAWGAASGVCVTDQPAAALQGAHALIDFTRPEATFGYLDSCAAAGVPLVIGTTGFDEAGRARIAAAAQRIPSCSPQHERGREPADEAGRTRRPGAGGRLRH
jgi:4-hydroxy-tetrahydrodipicolinate reductase